MQAGAGQSVGRRQQRHGHHERARSWRRARGHDRRHAIGERARFRARVASGRGAAASGARPARTAAQQRAAARQAAAGRGRQPRAGHETLHEQIDPVRAQRDIRLSPSVLHRRERQETARPGRVPQQLRIRQRAGVIYPHPTRSHSVPVRGTQGDWEGKLRTGGEGVRPQEARERRAQDGAQREEVPPASPGGDPHSGAPPRAG